MDQTAESDKHHLRARKSTTHDNASQHEETPIHEIHSHAHTTASLISLPPNLRAVTATFNTAELLEQILSYLPPLQLLRIKATCHSFGNAIEASPTLRRDMSTFLRLGPIDETDLFKSDAGGEVVFPVPGVDVLAFFYPEDGGRRLFVRFAVEPEGFARLWKAEGFRGLEVVDQAMVDVRVGWHCVCFEDGKGEARVKCEGWEGDGRVRFGEIFGAMEEKHRVEVEGYGLGEGGCGCVRKVWLDGLWGRSKEMRC